MKDKPFTGLQRARLFQKRVEKSNTYSLDDVSMNQTVILTSTIRPSGYKVLVHLTFKDTKYILLAIEYDNNNRKTGKSIDQKMYNYPYQSITPTLTDINKILKDNGM